MIRKRVQRTGDGSHETFALDIMHLGKTIEERDVEHFWGWNDELFTEDDKKDVTIINSTDDIQSQ
jgi:hypothetical protein